MKKLFLLITLILPLFLANGQSVQQLKVQIPTSPQAEAFQKFGDIAINYSTGTPDISIPLYEINHRGYKLPLALRYNPQPLKAGYNYDVYGQGWGLSINSCVSRSIEYLPDETRDFKIENNKLSDPYCLDCSPLSGSYVNNERRLDFSGYNFAHDKFNVVLPNGSSFNFIMDRDYSNNLTYKISDGRSVKINCIFTTGNIQKFEVTDEDGIKYIFDQGDLPHSLSGALNPNYYVSWQLTSINLPNSSDPITFTYTNSISSPIVACTEYGLKMSGDIHEMTSANGIPVYPPLYARGEDYSLANSGSSYGYTMKLPTSISYGNTNIYFQYGTTPREGNSHLYVQEMSIAEGSTRVRDVKLKMSMKSLYAGGCAGPFDLVKLDSVCISGSSTINKPQVYKCIYFDTGFYLSGTDHWGYLSNLNASVGVANFNVYTNFEIDKYNAMLTAYSSFLSPISTPQNYTYKGFRLSNGNNRHPSEPSEHGVLSSIWYPTGGHTDFVFENHRFFTSTDDSGEFISNPQNRIVARAAGFRIKKISNYNLDGTISKTLNFRYGSVLSTASDINQISSHTGVGEPVVDPNVLTYMAFSVRSSTAEIPSYHVRNMVLGINENGQHSNFLDPLKDLWLSGSKMLWECTFNALNFRKILNGRQPVVYPEVTVYYGDSESPEGCTGKTVYKYDIWGNAVDLLSGNYKDSIFFESPHYYGNVIDYEGKSYEYNKLKEKRDYKFENNNYKPVQSEKMEWNEQYQSYSDFIHTNPYPYLMAFSSDVLGTYLQTKVNYLGDSKLMAKETTQFVDNGDSIVSRESLNYNDRRQLASKTVTSSTGSVSLNSFSYPILSSDGNTPAIISTMVNKNMISPVIEAKTEVIGVGGSPTTTIAAAKVDYAQFNNNTLIAPAASYELNLKSTGNEYDLQNQINFYSPNGNPLEILSKNGISTVYLWSYDDRYLIAQIVNSTYGAVKAALGYSDSQMNSLFINVPDMSVINGLRTSLINAQVSTYTYGVQGTLISGTDPRGITTNYTYDTFNRLYLARDNDKYILGKYSYGYQNAPDNGQGGYEPPSAEITLGATNYTLNATGTANLGLVSGGSGSYTYSWYLKNSSGSILLNNTNTTSTSFAFTCSQIGSFTVQCTITDNITGQTTNKTQTVYCYIPATAGVSTGASWYVLNGVGSASVSVGNGSGNFSYAWSLKNSGGTVLQTGNNSTSFSYTCSQAGTLTVQCVVADNVTGRSAVDAKTISSYTLPTASVSTGASWYMLNGTGSASVAAGSGSGNFSYVWSLKNSSGTVLQNGSSSSFSYTCSQAGTLTVQCVVTDNVTGQTASDSKNISSYTVPSATVSTGATWYMINSTGTASVSPGGGSGSYSYSWVLKNSSNPNLASSTAGSTFSYTCPLYGVLTVQCTVTDNVTGQTATFARDITCHLYPGASVSVGATWYMLNGIGSASVNAGGGTGNFSYAWSLKNSGGTVLQTGNNATSFSYTCSQAGTLTVECKVTDNVTGQTVTDSRNITSYTYPTASVSTGASWYLINGGGNASVSGGNGSGNYSYSWRLKNSGGTVLQTGNNAASFGYTCSQAGTLTVECTVTDNVTGQTVTDSRNITSYTYPSATVSTGATWYMINGGGTASVSPGSGSGNYSYSWRLKNGSGTVLQTGNNATSFSYTCSQEGTLTVECTVTDNVTGQTATDSRNITSYTYPSASVSTGATWYILNATGTASLTASGGSGNLSYAWSLKNSSGTVLQSGTSPSFSYTCSQAGVLTVQCVVTDNVTGQTAISTKTLTCYTLPSANVSTGATWYMLNATGTASLTASGGSGNLSYAWSLKNSGGTVLKTGTSASFSYSCSQAGTLTVQCVVTDTNTGQTATDSKTIMCYTAQSLSLSVNSGSYTLNSTGIASVTVSDGSGNFTYKWKLTNSLGTVLLDVTTSDNLFYFPCPEAGTLIIESKVQDNVTGEVVNAYINIACNDYQTGNLNFAYGIYCYGSSLWAYGPDVNYSMSIVSQYSTIWTGYTMQVATVPQGFQPSSPKSTTFYSDGRTWQLTVNPDKSMVITLLNGPSVQPWTTLYFSGSYKRW